MSMVTNKTVFLSGPMTGRDHCNAEAFARAHAICKELGARRVYDPAYMWMLDFGSQGKTHADWMRECVHELTRRATCRPYYECVVLLPGWSQSAGSSLEESVAKACGIPCIDLADLEGGE